MLRATSEMAVAMSVRSVLENPALAASRRPSWRATTMSSSVMIGTRISFVTVRGLLDELVQERQAFLEVESGVHALEVEPELDHRESDLGLDADHDGVGAAQPRHVGDPAQRPGRERVHHV